MTTKVQGTNGIEFPDGSVQSSAAYSKAQSDGPAFMAVQAGTGQNSGAGVMTVVNFTDELFDTNNCFTPGTNAKFQPTVAGYYQLNWQVMFQRLSDGVGVFLSQIIKNGNLSLAVPKGAQFVETITATNNFCTSQGGALVYLNGTTDYVQVSVYTGVACLIVAGTPPDAQNTHFSGFLARRV